MEGRPFLLQLTLGLGRIPAAHAETRRFRLELIDVDQVLRPRD